MPNPTLAEMLRMNARELRAAGLLWPENLSDEQLEQEADNVRALDAPIASKMIARELQRRRGRRTS